MWLYNSIRTKDYVASKILRPSLISPLMRWGKPLGFGYTKSPVRRFDNYRFRDGLEAMPRFVFNVLDHGTKRFEPMTLKINMRIVTAREAFWKYQEVLCSRYIISSIRKRYHIQSFLKAHVKVHNSGPGERTVETWTKTMIVIGKYQEVD